MGGRRKRVDTQKSTANRALAAENESVLHVLIDQGHDGAAAESDGADGGADDSSAVVHCERADWERCASRRAAVGLVQAGVGLGQEGAPESRESTGTQRRWTLSSTSSL